VPGTFGGIDATTGHCAVSVATTSVQPFAPHVARLTTGPDRPVQVHMSIHVVRPIATTTVSPVLPERPATSARSDGLPVPAVPGVTPSIATATELPLSPDSDRTEATRPATAREKLSPVSPEDETAMALPPSGVAAPLQFVHTAAASPELPE
jgi:hypothetical protein